MAEYNPSKIIKDGNTYNFRDTTKIPLSGSNQISGDLIPATNNSIDIGSSTNNIKMLYTKGITINGTQFLPSDYATLSGLATVATSGSYNDLSNKPTIPTVNDATLTIQQNGTTVDSFSANSSSDKTVNIQCVDLTNNQTVAGNKEFTGTTTAHDLVPSATDTYNFGSSSAQWNNAYIKSLTINGVACGDILTHNASEFVGVTGAQTIAGVKTFSNIIYTSGQQIIIKSNNVERTVLPASTVYMAVAFSDKDSTGVVSRFGAVENVILPNGDINLDLRVYDFSSKTNVKTTIVLERKYDGTSNFYPEVSNYVNLGTATKKWKSLNGINPGALSLPGNYINVDTTNWVLDGTPNHFVPTSDGWLGIQAIDTVYDQMHYVFIGRTGGGSTYYQQNLALSVNALWDSKYHGCVFIPVVKNFNYDIRCICSTITATFYPCQGNV